MSNLRLPAPNSNVHRSLITFFSTFLAWIFGLMLALWQVPGVPKTFMDYVWNNSPSLLLLLGVPVAVIPGVVNFLLNLLFRSDTVPMY